MVGTLTHKEIEHLLEAQRVGRIGCCVEGKMYILPVQYVYHEGYVYAHAKEGLDIHILRMNPFVCFEVDRIDRENTWQSILLWGIFEELRYPGRGAEGIKLLHNRLHPEDASAARITANSALADSVQQAAPDRKPIAFRIKITESNGLFEKPEPSVQAHT